MDVSSENSKQPPFLLNHTFETALYTEFMSYVTKRDNFYPPGLVTFCFGPGQGKLEKVKKALHKTLGMYIAIYIFPPPAREYKKNYCLPSVWRAQYK